MLIIGGGATHRDDEKGEKRRKDTRKNQGERTNNANHWKVSWNPGTLVISLRKS